MCTLKSQYDGVVIGAFIKWEDEEPWGIEDLKKLEVKKDD